MAWAATGGIAAPPHPLPLLSPQQGFQPLKGQALGLGPDAGDPSVVEPTGAGGPAHQGLALMQFPDGIPEPGQLGRTRTGIRRR